MKVLLLVVILLTCFFEPVRSESNNPVHRYFSVEAVPSVAFQLDETDSLRTKYSDISGISAAFFPYNNFGLGYNYYLNNPTASDENFDGEYSIDYRFFNAILRTKIDRCTFGNPDFVDCQLFVSYGTGSSKYTYKPSIATNVGDIDEDGVVEVYRIGIHMISTWAFNLGARFNIIVVNTEFDKVSAISSGKVSINGNFTGIASSITWGF